MLKLVLIVSLNLIIGNMPSKLMFIAYYLMDSYTYNLLLTITNVLLFISHGNILFINYYFNDQFRNQFLVLIGKSKRDDQKN